MVRATKKGAVSFRDFKLHYYRTARYLLPAGDALVKDRAARALAAIEVEEAGLGGAGGKDAATILLEAELTWETVRRRTRVGAERNGAEVEDGFGAGWAAVTLLDERLGTVQADWQQTRDQSARVDDWIGAAGAALALFRNGLRAAFAGRQGAESLVKARNVNGIGTDWTARSRRLDSLCADNLRANNVETVVWCQNQETAKIVLDHFWSGLILGGGCTSEKGDKRECLEVHYCVVVVCLRSGACLHL